MMRYSAVLLAGGKSLRMGRDKALLEIEDQPLWQRQLATLRQLSPEQLLLAGPAPPHCDCDMIVDEIVNAGPLGGLAAALRHSTAPLLVALAIDLPSMTAEFLRTLLDECRLDRGVVPRAPRQNSGADGFRYEPLAAVYPVTSLGLTLETLHRGGFSMQAFIRAALDRGYLRERQISPHELTLFTNLNTPADYEEFRARETHPGR